MCAVQTSHEVAAEAFFSKFGEYFLKAGLCGTCEKGDDADTPLTAMFAPLLAGAVNKVLAYTEALRTVPFGDCEIGSDHILKRVCSTMVAVGNLGPCLVEYIKFCQSNHSVAKSTDLVTLMEDFKKQCIDNCNDKFISSFEKFLFFES